MKSMKDMKAPEISEASFMPLMTFNINPACQTTLGDATEKVARLEKQKALPRERKGFLEVLDSSD